MKVWMTDVSTTGSGLMTVRSVIAFGRDGDAVESFAGGDDGEIEFLDNFFEVVGVGRGGGRLVDGGDCLEGLAHEFKGSVVHKGLSFRNGMCAESQELQGIVAEKLGAELSTDCYFSFMNNDTDTKRLAEAIEAFAATLTEIMTEKLRRSRLAMR